MTCPACGAELSISTHPAVPDFEHGLPVTVAFKACPQCGMLAQVPAPTAEALSHHYPADYRPHTNKGLISSLKDLQASARARRLSVYINRDSRILDLGCGGGHFLRALKRAGYTKLTGIDRRPEQGTALALEQIDYRPLDLDQSTELGGPYDVIVMNYVIEHFADPAAVLSASKRALAPGGRIIVLTPNPASWSHRLFGRYWSGLHAPRHTQLFTPRALKEVAIRVGFQDVKFDYDTDAASWTLSFQNLVQDVIRKGKAPHQGTAWYSLLLLPAWFPIAWFDKVFGSGSAMYGILYS